MAQTWIINEDLSSASYFSDSNLLFSSNNESFYGFTFIPTISIQFEGRASTTNKWVLLTGTWKDANGNDTTYALTPYKTITFETAPTGDLLTWLQANAVLQVDNTIKFGSSTISKLMLGSSEVDALYLGSNKLYEQVKYTISATTTNVTASASNPSTITEGSTATLTFTADGTSYKMPTSITVGSTTVPAGTSTTVSGVATFLYTRTGDTSGSIVISNPTSNVSFTVSGEAVATSHALTFDSNFNGYITLNGTSVTSPSIINSGDQIVVSSFATGSWYSNFIINGTTYVGTETISLPNVDITIGYESAMSAKVSETMTINC